MSAPPPRSARSTSTSTSTPTDAVAGAQPKSAAGKGSSRTVRRRRWLVGGVVAGCLIAAGGVWGGATQEPRDGSRSDPEDGRGGVSGISVDAEATRRPGDPEDDPKQGEPPPLAPVFPSELAPPGSVPSRPAPSAQARSAEAGEATAVPGVLTVPGAPRDPGARWGG